MLGKSSLRNVLITATLGLLMASNTFAATIYWDGLNSAPWETITNWSTDPDRSWFEPDHYPTTGDIASFSISTAPTTQICGLTANESIDGLVFKPRSFGAVYVRSNAATPYYTLTIGASGITVDEAAANASYIGNYNANRYLNLALSASQTWANNSTTQQFYQYNNVTVASGVGDVLLTLSGGTAATCLAYATESGAYVSVISDGDSGKLSIQKDGVAGNRWIMGGNNTYTGTTTINGGYLDIRSATALGSVAGETIVNTGAQLYVDQAINCPEPVTINGNGQGEVGIDGALRLANFTGTYSGPITLGSDARVAVAQTGNWTITGSINNAGNNLIIGGPVANNSGTLNINGAISGGGQVIVDSLTTNGPVTLSGANTYTGNTSVLGGSLVLANQNALQNSTYGGGGGTLVFSSTVSGHAFTFGGLNGSNNLSLVDNASNAVALSVGNNNADVTYAGVLSGGGSLIKVGTGTQMLIGTNSYAGATTVQAGTLELDVNAQSPVLAGAGGANIQGGKLVLDYTGTAPDVFTPLKASYLASPSWSTGQLRNTTAGTTGLTLGWKDDTTNMQVTVMATLAGDANLDGSVTGADLSLLLSKYNQSGTWSVGDFNYDGSVTGADLSLLLSKYNQSIPASVAGAAVAGVPEPSSLVMLAALAAAMGLGVAGRRRFAARRLLRTFRVSILKEVAMKRLLILGVCIVMGSALTARASVMPFGTFTKGGESVAVDYTRTAQSGALAGLDLVILSVDSINGAGSSLINGMVSAGVGNPTFTGLNGSYMYICDPGTVYITNSLPAFTAPGSYINFDSVAGAFAGTLKSGAPVYAATVGAVHGYSEWSAGVFTNGAGTGVGGTLAAIYVPNNGNFQLVGGLSLLDGNVLTGSGMTTSDIPEPTTLALLATGLVGLLAYAWRKRK